MKQNKYLEQYAEIETTGFQNYPNRYYQHVLIIPAFDEPFDFIDRIQKTFNNKDKLLVIVIVNAPSNLPDQSSAVINTQHLLSQLHQLPLIWQSQNHPHIQLHAQDNIDWLAIDRVSPQLRIPSQHGVGLARKIAADIGYSLIQKEHVKTQWIHCTDADTILPTTYFNHYKCDKSAALIYPFIHKVRQEENSQTLTFQADLAAPEPHSLSGLDLCSWLYEHSLHYYVEGLKFSQSPYAYHTIGSTQCINAEAYAKVRGFPKKTAGEDFYLLNKLAKTGAITTLEGPIITIEARCSSRVPFGTGPALVKLLAQNDAKQSPLFYDPICFRYLKLFISIIPELHQAPLSRLKDVMVQNCHNINFSETESNLNPLVLYDTIIELGIEKIILHSQKQSSYLSQFCNHMQQWFDSFKTMKFIHTIRDSQHPLLNYENISQRPEFQEIMSMFGKNTPPP